MLFNPLFIYFISTALVYGAPEGAVNPANNPFVSDQNDQTPLINNQVDKLENDPTLAPSTSGLQSGRSNGLSNGRSNGRSTLGYPYNTGESEEANLKSSLDFDRTPEQHLRSTFVKSLNTFKIAIRSKKEKKNLCYLKLNKKKTYYDCVKERKKGDDFLNNQDASLEDSLIFPITKKDNYLSIRRSFSNDNTFSYLIKNEYKTDIYLDERLVLSLSTAVPKKNSKTLTLSGYTATLSHRKLNPRNSPVAREETFYLKHSKVVDLSLVSWLPCMNSFENPIRLYLARPQSFNGKDSINFFQNKSLVDSEFYIDAEVDLTFLDNISDLPNYVANCFRKILDKKLNFLGLGGKSKNKAFNSANNETNDGQHLPNGS